MHGSIRERGKGSWTIEIPMGFDPVTGKRRRIWHSFRGTKKQAQAELARLIHETQTGIDPTPARITVSDYLDRWLRHMETRVRPMTWNGYEGLVRRNVVPVIGSLPLGKLRPVHVQSVVDKMIADGLAARTTIQAYRVLHQSLKQARRWQLIPTNPAEAVSPPRANRPTLTTPTSNDLRNLIEASKGTREEIAIVLLVATGMRRGELLALRWSDIDTRDGVRININNALQRSQRGRELVFVEPKTDRARRTVALPDFAIEALRRYRKEQAQRRLSLGEIWKDRDLIVDRGDGTPIDPDTFSHTFKRIAKNAGLDGVRLHDVRHGYATALLLQGVNPKITSEALGHSSVAFTLDTYSHIIPSMQRAAADAIGKAIEGI